LVSAVQPASTTAATTSGAATRTWILLRSVIMTSSFRDGTTRGRGPGRQRGIPPCGARRGHVDTPRHDGPRLSDPLKTLHGPKLGRNVRCSHERVSPLTKKRVREIAPKRCRAACAVRRAGSLRVAVY